MIMIDEEKCDECGTCISVCPANAVILEEDLRISGDKCADCGRCATICPFGALSVRKYCSPNI